MNFATTMYSLVIAMTFLPTGEMAAQSKLAYDAVNDNTGSVYTVVSPRNGNGPICVAKVTDLTELKISCDEQISKQSITPEAKSAAPKEDKTTDAGPLARTYVLVSTEDKDKGTHKEWKPLLDPYFSKELREKIAQEADLVPNSLLRRATAQNGAHGNKKEAPTQN
ncbi:hypothetical protein DdX_06621 [Ditylenchus destructor]|uniref:Uncharacterized protein n=1 Tax=Ditylenchus destructor TaxID=166010 RepID=A0AAD4N7H0_9BILA|nr:hypothetical protein DdX_06621 [Ditylenchus destructor]